MGIKVESTIDTARHKQKQSEKLYENKLLSHILQKIEYINCCFTLKFARLISILNQCWYFYLKIPNSFNLTPHRMVTGKSFQRSVKSPSSGWYKNSSKNSWTQRKKEMHTNEILLFVHRSSRYFHIREDRVFVGKAVRTSNHKPCLYLIYIQDVHCQNTLYKMKHLQF